eukprot:GHVU01226232.1.p2 GENE.GHVU01226232.1~~GHVU01226232.1.p2  ORF type:complete len:188 (+),score=64.09 GHVU01226232.1:1740-2303(+)
MRVYVCVTSSALSAAEPAGSVAVSRVCSLLQERPPSFSSSPIAAPEQPSDAHTNCDEEKMGGGSPCQLGVNLEEAAEEQDEEDGEGEEEEDDGGQHASITVEEDEGMVCSRMEGCESTETPERAALNEVTGPTRAAEAASTHSGKCKQMREGEQDDDEDEEEDNQEEEEEEEEQEQEEQEQEVAALA